MKDALTSKSQEEKKKTEREAKTQCKKGVIHTDITVKHTLAFLTQYPSIWIPIIISRSFAHNKTRFRKKTQNAVVSVRRTPKLDNPRNDFSVRIAEISFQSSCPDPGALSKMLNQKQIPRYEIIPQNQRNVTSKSSKLRESCAAKNLFPKKALSGKKAKTAPLLYSLFTAVPQKSPKKWEKTRVS